MNLMNFEMRPVAAPDQSPQEAPKEVPEEELVSEVPEVRSERKQLAAALDAKGFSRYGSGDAWVADWFAFSPESDMERSIIGQKRNIRTLPLLVGEDGSQLVVRIESGSVLAQIIENAPHGVGIECQLINERGEVILKAPLENTNECTEWSGALLVNNKDKSPSIFSGNALEILARNGSGYSIVFSLES